ncbi:MAG: TonB-dependent receptor [Gemmatimonadetes bacterium]|nr:TonB-dependent receptor [Gemmatimonadota bacterium]
MPASEYPPNESTGTAVPFRRPPTPARISAPFVLLLAAASGAAAQQARRDTARATRLDTVAVRVLHAPISAARAPYAVTAVDERTIRRAKPGMALDEALGDVPGVQVDNRFNYALGERISVRGFGARAQFGVRGVHVLVDGIPATMPDGQTTLNHVDLGALGRAEVVRGPASALYGNASGGVVQLAGAAPPTVPFGTEYHATGGSDGLLRLRTGVGGTVRGVAYQGSVSRLRYDGFRRHQQAESTLGSARVGFGVAGGQASLAFHAVNYDAQNPGSLSDSLLRVDRTQAFAGNVAQNTGEAGRHREMGASWTAPAGPGSLTLSAYGVTRRLRNPIPNRIIDLDRRAGGLRAAFSAPVALLGSPSSWTVGGEVDGQRDDRLNFVNQKGLRGPLALDQRERVAAASAFAEAVAPLGPHADVLAAVRWDRHRFSVADRLTGPQDPDDSGARTMHAWSPTLGVSLRPAGALTLYANVATAFETPTTTELANRPDGAGGFNPALEPSRTLSFEAGAKGHAAAWLSCELAAYRARVRGELIPFEVPNAPGRQFFRNAGSAIHRGVEASASATLPAGLGGRLAYAWTDARFREYVAGTSDLAGNRVPGIAPHRVSGTLSWSAPAGPFAELAGRYEAATPTDDANTARSPAFAVLDLRAGWDGARIGWGRATPFAGVTNLLDRAYNASVTINAFGRRYFEPGPGRAAYVGLDLVFGR